MGILYKITAILVVTSFMASCQKQKNSDEDKPYEFGFVIDGEQHRHEKKDANGIIQGEFGFITADGVYHVTVYATDENGNFRILSMKNIRLGDNPNAQLAGKTSGAQAKQPSPGINVLSASTTPGALNQGFTTAPTKKPGCASCGIPTPVPPPSENTILNVSNNKLNAGAGNNYNPLNGGGVNNQNSGGFVGGTPGLGNNNYNQPGTPGLGDTGSNNYNQPGTPSLGDTGNNNYNQPGTPGLGDTGNNNYNQPGLNNQYPGQAPEVGNQNYGLNNQYPGGAVGVNNKNGQDFNYNQNTGNTGLNNPNYNGGSDDLNKYHQQVQQNINTLQDNINNIPNNQIQQNLNNQAPQINPLSNVNVVNNEIQIPGNNPIPIKDKFPGMSEGLPEGIEETDIKDLLYKFNYTVGFHGHYEKGLKNGAKVGGYFVNGRDGVSRIVTYVADENGYRPKVKFIRLGLDSDKTPKEETEKSFGLVNFEFVWYPIN